MIVIEDARTLVEEGDLESCDWRILFPGVPGDRLTNRQKLQMVFDNNTYSIEFVDHILEHGVLDPIYVDSTRRPYILSNGHHRLAIAYRHGLKIPVEYIDMNAPVDRNRIHFGPDKGPLSGEEYVNYPHAKDWELS